MSTPQLAAVFAAAILAASAMGGEVVATWEVQLGQFAVVATYKIEAKASIDRGVVYLPGEEVTLTLDAAGGELTVEIRHPWGRPVRHVLTAPPGGKSQFTLDLAPGVKAFLTLEMAVTAAVEAVGAEPQRVYTKIPSSLKFKTSGDATFNVTFYAAPTVTLGVEMGGVSLELFSQRLAEEAFRPSVVVKVAAFPWHYAAAAGAGSLLLALYLKRRRKQKDKSF